MNALRRDAALTFVGCGAGGGLLCALFAQAVPLDWRFVTATALVYAAIALVTLMGLPGSHPHDCFGAANRVTTVRAAITALFGGLAVAAQPMQADQAWLWAFAVLAILALVLDGMDGWLSRRLGMVSRFGARYDMEVDALLIALLSIVVWRLGKAGAWVLAIGALRYVFIAASARWPWLGAPLPARRRRQAICVIQGAVLCALIAPPFGGTFSHVLAATALGLLAASFAIDVRWLLQRAPRPAVRVRAAEGRRVAPSSTTARAARR